MEGEGRKWHAGLKRAQMAGPVSGDKPDRRNSGEIEGIVKEKFKDKGN